MKQIILRGIFVLAFALSAIGYPIPPAFAEKIADTTITSDGLEYVPGRVIVKLREGDIALADRLPGESSRSLSLERISTELEQTFIQPLPAGEDPLAVAAELEKDPAVEYAEPDYIARAAAAPDDPRYSEQWALAKIHAEGAWAYTQGSPSVTIAVIDSGVQTDHPDLNGALWVNPGETPGNGLDDDNNGYVDDVNGWNFVSGNNDISDENGHGTQVAGVAAARTNNAAGIAGVCGNCRVMVIKVMQPGGAVNYSDIAAGIRYAAAKGADVINLSLGGYANSHTLQDAVDAVTSQGVLVVAGAGNDNKSSAFYPAAFDSALAVAASDDDDLKHSTSNFGAWVDLTAPGKDILTTAMGGDYLTDSGTSLAAPFVSGVAGLLFSLHPDWSSAMLKAQLSHTAASIDSLNPGLEGKLGAGRLDAQAAMQDPTPDLAISSFAVDGAANAKPTPGTSVQLTLTLNNRWAQAQGIQTQLTSNDPLVSVTQASSTYPTIAAGQSAQNSTAFVLNIGATGYSHAMNFSLTISANGGAYTASLPLTLYTRSSEENVSGTLTGDTTWTNDKIYKVNADINVPAGKTLTIQPGTVVKFNGAYRLNVRGKLVADGTEEQPISFGPYTSGQTWNGILFDDSSEDAIADADGNYTSGNLLRHVSMQGSEPWISCTHATPFLESLDLKGSITNLITCSLGDTPLWLRDSSVVNLQTNGPQNSMGIWISGQVNILNNTISNSLVTLTGGSATIRKNRLTNSCFSTQSSAVVEQNRILGCMNEGAIHIQNGLVQGNLISGGKNGVVVAGDAEVKNNTFENNSGISVDLTGGTTFSITGNNFVRNSGPTDLANRTTQPVSAGGNWWGTSDTSAIAARILDYYDDDLKGEVTYQPSLTAPSQTAPAFVTGVTLDKGDTVGIETGTFTAEFSRPMQVGEAIDKQVNLGFRTTRYDTWQSYKVLKAETPASGVTSIAIDPLGNRWFGTGLEGVYEFKTDGTWQNYNTSNSGLTNNFISSMAIDSQGNIWFGTGMIDVLKKDGTWKTYNNSDGLVGNGINAIAIDQNGNRWFGTENDGISVLKADGTWQNYNNGNSPLVNNHIRSIAFDSHGNRWFGTEGGLSVFKTDGSWQSFDTGNSGLTNNNIRSIAFDSQDNLWIGNWAGVNILKTDGSWQTYIFGMVNKVIIDDLGNHWFGTMNGLRVLKADGTLQLYNNSNGLESTDIKSLAVDLQGNLWAGGLDGKASVLYHTSPTPITDNPQWLDSTHYRANYDFNSLTPTGTYNLLTSGAVGEDGLEIAPYTGSPFTVSYAGGVSDTTPPAKPQVNIQGFGTLTSLSASWSAADGQSGITAYRYAIGATPGAADVVGWTDVGMQTSISRNDLNLLPDQDYYLSVKARNGGGLWSLPGVSLKLCNGEVEYLHIFLPAVRK